MECEAIWYGSDEDDGQRCELPRGHKGEHRVTIQWAWEPPKVDPIPPSPEDRRVASIWSAQVMGAFASASVLHDLVSRQYGD